MKVEVNRNDEMPKAGDLHVTDGDMPERAGSGWQGMNNYYLWTSATDDVFKDCVIPATTFDYNLRLMNS